ncbi:MAG: diguanylate cyclase, partial [Sedimenticolaceae bacterium]
PMAFDATVPQKECTEAFSRSILDNISRPHILLDRDMRIVALKGEAGRLFAVLLPGHDSDQARETAEGLRHAATHFRFAWQNQQIAIGISIGVVAVDGKIYQPDDVVTAADAALLMAKENGRDRVVVYQPVTDAG